MTNSLGLIGLSMKAGKLKSGEFSVEQAIKSMDAHLVIIAENASDNTKKKFKNMCDYRKVPYLIGYSKEDLGRAVGKEIRATLCIIDENFAKNIEKTWR